MMDYTYALFSSIHLLIFGLICSSFCYGQNLLLADKKDVSHYTEKFPLTQNESTENLKEYPFIEIVSDPMPLPDEKARGFILFTRPLTAPVYPNSRPLPAERIDSVITFATPSQFEAVNFVVYPLREMKNLRVSVSDLTDGINLLSHENIKIQQVLYWNVRYPRYNSIGSYRLVPEFIKEVTVDNTPPFECRRYWLTIKVPDDATAGLYNGKINISYDGFEKAVELPLKLRILSFKLKSDPNKKYSVYYNDLHRTKFMNDKGMEWVDKTMERQYKVMRDYGLNAFPVLYLSYDGNGLSIPFADITIKQLRDAGFSPPIPVVGCGIYNFYKKHTGKDMQKHHLTPERPPEEIYTEIETNLKTFLSKAKQNGYPEMVFCPLDEIDPQAKEIAIRVYKIFHDQGVKTFATKDPKGDMIAQEMAPYVDYWSSIPFSMNYFEIKKDEKHGYWTYPNHNAWEFKDPIIMCKGGRMTYGFGNWKSGYNMYMPWQWGGLNREYLNQRKDSGGNRLEEDGSYTMTTYWECFREGIDDARYIYTLEDAIIKRKNTSNAELKKLLDSGYQLLQGLWDSIDAQELYTDNGMWCDSDFDARRWELALLTEQIIRYPESNNDVADSVIINPVETKAAYSFAISKVIQDEIKKGNAVHLSIDENNIKDWQSIEKGTSLSLDKIMFLNGNECIKMNISIEHSLGEKGPGQYLYGWPRMYREYKRPGLDISDYEFFSMWFKIESNRNDVANDRSPFYISLKSYLPVQLRDYTMTGELEERQWHFLLIPTAKIFGNALPDALKSIKCIQFGISENLYNNGDKISFYMSGMEFIKLKKPIISNVETPEILLLPAENLLFKIDILGNSKVDLLKATVELRDERNDIVARGVFPVNAVIYGALPVKGLKNGEYYLSFQLNDGNGLLLSSMKKKFRAINGFDK